MDGATIDDWRVCFCLFVFFCLYLFEHFAYWVAILSRWVQGERMATFLPSVKIRGRADSVPSVLWSRMVDDDAGGCRECGEVGRFRLSWSWWCWTAAAAAAAAAAGISNFRGRPRAKCRRLTNSASSTIQYEPKSSSYRTKHLCSERLVRMAFFVPERDKTERYLDK